MTGLATEFLGKHVQITSRLFPMPLSAAVVGRLLFLSQHRGIDRMHVGNRTRDSFEGGEAARTIRVALRSHVDDLSLALAIQDVRINARGEVPNGVTHRDGMAAKLLARSAEAPDVTYRVKRHPQ